MMMRGTLDWAVLWGWLVALLAVAAFVVVIVAVTTERLGGGLAVAAAAIPAVVAVAALAVPLSLRQGYVAVAAPTCRPPALPGTLVDVTLSDMHGMMGGRMPAWRNGQGVVGPGGMMGGGAPAGGMMGAGGTMGGGTASGPPPSGAPYGRMMNVLVSPSTVPAGTVSLRVWNAGGLVHELVVLPVGPGGLGSAAVGADGKVSEAGSLGEASKTCGADAGAGIAPGASGWVTLTLPAGRYELICNLPGHYAMGMYAELDVG